MFPNFKYAIIFSAACAASLSHAVLKWDGCADLAATDFKSTDIATRTKDDVNEPMKLAFDLLAAPGEDAKGKVDVYFTERLGRVRKFDSKTNTVMTLATIPLNINAANSSDGVLGIALDPAFKTNNQVYLYYTYVNGTEKNWRVSRFTLNPAHTSLDLASEIPVIKVPILSGSKHPGGDIKFDAYGDLWISTGNDYQSNEYPLYSSPNTNDLRGKILRIHPTADGKYTIPKGNLFAEGTANTRPEIYIMGNRNPYTIALDPVRRWLMWGDIGPDFKDFDGNPMNGTGATEKTEEFDLAKAPGNYGYPFFAGDYMTRKGTDPNAPAMPAGYDWEKGTVQPGLTTLPKAIAPIYAYKKSCAITGPLYRYDGDLKSTVKFPPHFTRKWLWTDFNGDNNKMNVFTLNDDGTAITGQEQVIAGIPLHAPLDLEFGPDGALYVNNYSGYRTRTTTTGIIRIDYTGNCQPNTPKLETSTGIAGEKALPRGPEVGFIQGRVLAVSLATSDRVELEVRDLRGRPVAAKTAMGPGPISLEEVRAPGVYFLSVKSPAGSRVVKFAKE
jgi:glucose/arabinose dehydrogenase